MRQFSRFGSALVWAIISLSAWNAALSQQTRPSDSLAARLDPVLDRLASKGAVIHARMLELPLRRELYARRSDDPCTPASNLKLLTTATGLDMFGPQKTFKTYLAMDGDDLWLIGTGDPGPGDYRLAKAAGVKPTAMLEEWAKALKARGITRIAGDLVYYDGAFENQRVHPLWYKHFLVDWYAAPVAGLNFNDNNIDITVLPGEEGKPARYELMPPVTNITVENGCITGLKKTPTIAKVATQSVYKLGGGCKERTELKSKPVDDPGAFFADALRTHLAAASIEIAGKTRRAETPLGGVMPPPEAKVVAVRETKITDVLARINKNSQNMFAECLCKLNGQEFDAREGRRASGSWEAGGKAVHAFLKRSGIDDSRLNYVDGSGLSDRNRVTTRILTDLLAVMFSRPDAEVYRNSMTIVGVDGSLKDRMPALKGRVYGKTGYIGGVCSTSGYLQTRAGKWLAFSFIYNNVPEVVGDDEDTKAYQKLHDEACTILGDWPDLKPTTATHSAE